MSASSLVLIRVPAIDRHLIEHALDARAQGVLVPKAESREQAALAAGACRYPPTGTRGVNPIRASAYFTGTSLLRPPGQSVQCRSRLGRASTTSTRLWRCRGWT
jgi:2-keto-3-deoxy-L-rhamnonate aldolase RhmA